MKKAEITIDFSDLSKKGEVFGRLYAAINGLPGRTKEQYVERSDPHASMAMADHLFGMLSDDAFVESNGEDIALVLMNLDEFWEEDAAAYGNLMWVMGYLVSELPSSGGVRFSYRVSSDRSISPR